MVTFRCARCHWFVLSCTAKLVKYEMSQSCIVGKSEFLGADLMIPLLVMCLIHAKVPCIHLTMVFPYSPIEIALKITFYSAAIHSNVWERRSLWRVW